MLPRWVIGQRSLIKLIKIDKGCFTKADGLVDHALQKKPSSSAGKMRTANLWIFSIISPPPKPAKDHASITTPEKDGRCTNTSHRFKEILFEFQKVMFIPNLPFQWWTLMIKLSGLLEFPTFYHSQPKTRCEVQVRALMDHRLGMLREYTGPSSGPCGFACPVANNCEQVLGETEKAKRWKIMKTQGCVDSISLPSGNDCMWINSTPWKFRPIKYSPLNQASLTRRPWRLSGRSWRMSETKKCHLYMIHRCVTIVNMCNAHKPI